MRWRILLYPGFDELDAVAPFEVLSMAVRRGAPWTVRLEALGGAEEVTASNGLRVRVAADDSTPTVASGPDTGAAPRIDRARELAHGAPADGLIVPGGGWVDRSRVGARSEYERGDAPGTVAFAARSAHAGGAVVASVCTGAMLLARAGLLRGRRCVTHRAAIEDLRAEGAVIVPARVVDDGEIVTAGGVTSGIDLALHLVERFASRELADGIATTLEHDRARAASAARIDPA